MTQETTPPRLAPDDLRFLARPLHGFLSVAAGPVPAQPRPVWFETTPDGSVQFFSEAGAAKVRRLQRDPRASLVVAAPVAEHERWIALNGHVTLEPEGAAELARRLAGQYWDLSDPVRQDLLAGMLAGDLVRLVLHVDAVSRYAFVP